jgi:hypothetical protein
VWVFASSLDKEAIGKHAQLAEGLLLKEEGLGKKKTNKKIDTQNKKDNINTNKTEVNR